MFKELGLGNLKFEHCLQFDDKGNPTGDACRQTIYKKKPEP